MKQLNVTEKQIDEYTFYIRPLGAFAAANISAELVNLFSPVLAVLTPLLGNLDLSEDADQSIDIMDMDAEKVIEAASPALSKINGDKLESLMKRLLIANKNISVNGPATDNKTVLLNEDVANEVFCEDLQNMFILAFEVVRVNYKGFFKKLGARSGNLIDLIRSPKTTPKSSESST